MVPDFLDDVVQLAQRLGEAGASLLAGQAAGRLQGQSHLEQVAHHPVEQIRRRS